MINNDIKIKMTYAVFNTLNNVCDIRTYYNVFADENGDYFDGIIFTSYMYIDEKWFDMELSKIGLNEYFKVKKLRIQRNGEYADFKLYLIKYNEALEGLYSLTRFK